MMFLLKLREKRYLKRVGLEQACIIVIGLWITPPRRIGDRIFNSNKIPYKLKIRTKADRAA